MVLSYVIAKAIHCIERADSNILFVILNQETKRVRGKVLRKQILDTRLVVASGLAFFSRI